MAKYKVIVTETLAHYYTVEATSKEEAEELVLEGDATMDDTKEVGFDIFEVEEVK